MKPVKTISAELIKVGRDVPSAPSDNRAERIVAYHNASKRSAAQQLVYALLAGAELNTIKEEIAHGQFQKWIASNLADIPYPTANRYMRFADALQPLLLDVAKVDLPRLQLTNGEIKDDQLAGIAAAVREVTDGKTLTDLYRDFGLVKEPTHQKDRDNKKKVTPEEADAAQTELALQSYRDAIASDHNLFEDDEVAGRVENTVLKEKINSAVALTKWLRAILKARGKGTPQKKTKSTKKKGAAK